VSNRDASQGMVPDPAQLRGNKIRELNTTAIFQSIQRAMNAADADATKPRPPQKVGDKQDWRRG
jgi:hypothetical protein